MNSENKYDNKTKENKMSEDGTFKTQDWKNLVNGLLVVIGVLICAISAWNVNQISKLRQTLDHKMSQVSELKIETATLEERIKNVESSENEHYIQLLKKFEKLDKKIDNLKNK